MSKPLSPEYLAEIAARAEAVTDGPWGPYLGATLNVFIAHARTDVPALLAEVERLRAALSSATDVIAERDDEVGDWSAKNAALRAELAGRPTRAEVLRETANNWMAHCPDHSNDADEVWMDCPCYWTDEMRRAANEAEAGESK